MFEYLSGVVRKRDVEISDLKQESTEATRLRPPRLYSVFSTPKLP